MKKIIILVLSILFAISILCGCGETKKVDNDKVYDWTYDVSSYEECDSDTVIDGKLDDARWSNKKYFTHSEGGVEMKVTTSFSKKGLYIGGIAYDKNIRWIKRMDIDHNSTFWFSVKDEDTIIDVSSTTAHFCMDSKNVWDYNNIGFSAKTNVEYENDEPVSLTAEMFVSWENLNIKTKENEEYPSVVRINPRYNYYDTIEDSCFWMYGLFAFADKDRGECSVLFDENGYINEDKEGAVLGNAGNGYAKSDGWDLSELSEGAVTSNVDHSQGIFFKGIYSSCYWYTVTVEIQEDIYNKLPAAAGVMDTVNQAYCSTFFLDGTSARSNKNSTYTTINFNDNGRYGWRRTDEGRIMPNYADYDGKVEYTVVKDGGYFYYIVNGEYVMQKYISFLNDKSCPGFFTLDAKARYTNYEAHDLSNDRSQVDEILGRYNVYRVKVEDEDTLTGGEITLSSSAVCAGENVDITILPANRNILSGFVVNGVDCFDDLIDNLNNGVYTISNITRTIVIKPTFTRLSQTTEVSGLLTTSNGKYASGMTVTLKGNNPLLYYSLESGGNGTYKFFVPTQGNYSVGGKNITVDGNYELILSGGGYLPQTHNILVTSKITDNNYTIEEPYRTKESYGIIEIEDNVYTAADELTQNEANYEFFNSSNHTSALLKAEITIPKNTIMTPSYGVGFTFTSGKTLTEDHNNGYGGTRKAGEYDTREIGLTEYGMFSSSFMLGANFRIPGAWGVGTWNELQYNSSCDSVWLGGVTKRTLTLALVDDYFYVWIDDTFIQKISKYGNKYGDVYYMIAGLDASQGYRFGVYFYNTQGVDFQVKVDEKYDNDALTLIHNSSLYSLNVFPEEYIDNINKERGEKAQQMMIKSGDTYENIPVSYTQYSVKNPGYYYFAENASTTAIISATFTMPVVDENILTGFTMVAGNDLEKASSQSIQFYVGRPGFSTSGVVYSYINHGIDKCRFSEMEIFGEEDVVLNLTLILYNDTIYFYINGVLCTLNFNNCYTMPTSISDPSFKSQGLFSSGTAFRFGLAEMQCWLNKVKISNVVYKTGDDALTEINNNYLYNITWLNYDDTTLSTTKVFKGLLPTYSGVPTKERTIDYRYKFTGWTPSVVEVSKDTSYKAVFEELPNVMTVIWKDVDGTILETDTNVTYNATPSYDGKELTSILFDNKLYSNHIGWSPELASVTDDITYTAVYKDVQIVTNNVTKQGDIYTTTSTGWASTNYAYTSLKDGALQYGTTAIYSVKITSNGTFDFIYGNEGMASIIFSQGEIMPADTIYNRDILDNTMYACNIGFRSTTYTSLAYGRTVVPQSVPGGNGTFGGVYGSCPLLSKDGTVTLTVVYVNNVLFIYVDGVYITNVSLTDSRFSATTTGKRSYSFTENAPLTFGFNAFNTSTTFSFEVLKQLYGTDALNELKNNNSVYKWDEWTDYDTVNVLRGENAQYRFVKCGDSYKNIGINYVSTNINSPGYYYLSGEASNVAVLSARVQVPSLDPNAHVGFTLTSSADLSDTSKSIQFYVNKDKVISTIKCNDDGEKYREYMVDSPIFTTDKLYADITLVLYNDTIYLYIDGVLCTGNFSSCYTMPVAITNINLNENDQNIYSSGTPFRFGLTTTRSWGNIITVSNVSLKTGSDATNEITNNNMYTAIVS